jgi:hypothetical protein
MDIVSERRRVRRFLRDIPLNIIVVDQPMVQDYGHHYRSPPMWPFIGITKYFTDRWAAAEDEELKLAFEAVLKGTIAHELGHWFFTLVRSI